MPHFQCKIRNAVGLPECSSEPAAGRTRMRSFLPPPLQLQHLSWSRPSKASEVSLFVSHSGPWDGGVQAPKAEPKEPKAKPKVRGPTPGLGPGQGR